MGLLESHEPQPDAGGTITGSGTINYLPAFDSATSITDSIIYQTLDPIAGNSATVEGDFNINGISNLYGNINAQPTNSTSGTAVNFAFYGATDTTQTATAEINRFLISSGNRQWDTGAIALQREVYITAPNYSFVTASTITNAYTFYARAPVAGTNATITNNWAAGFEGNVNITGSLNIGNYATPSAQRLVTIGQHTAWVSVGSWVGATSSGAIYINQATPSVSNYSLAASTSVTYVNGNNQVDIVSAGVSLFQLSRNTNVIMYKYIPSNTTGHTASTELPKYQLTSSSMTFSTGALTTQRFAYFQTQTLAFSGASTATDVYGMYVEAATAGANATITNNWALGLSGALEVDGKVSLKSAGNGIFIKEGTNATMGVATCDLTIGGVNSMSVTVNTTKVTANSRIFFTTNASTDTTTNSQVPTAFVLSRVAGTSFTIGFSSDLILSYQVAWIIIEPN